MLNNASILSELRRIIDALSPWCKSSENALYEAAKSGNMERVEELLKQGYFIHTKHQNGYTLLHGAAQRGNLELVQWLIEHGADVKVNNKFERPVLYSAVRSGNLELVKFLKDHGAEE